MTVQHTISTRATNMQDENTKMCESKAYLAEIQKVQQTATTAATDTLGGHHPTKPRRTCEISLIWAANACRTHHTLQKSVKHPNQFFCCVFQKYLANASPIVAHGCTYIGTTIWVQLLLTHLAIENDSWGQYKISNVDGFLSTRVVLKISNYRIFQSHHIKPKCYSWWWRKN